jgi:hypothetical protein
MQGQMLWAGGNFESCAADEIGGKFEHGRDGSIIVQL